jgi:HD superfamily phosphohydrolase
MAEAKLNYYDSLYGQVSFKGALAGLIESPVLQRMRHVRLSNIDSIAMPGIANLSRYEHVLGVGYLAQHVGLLPHLGTLDRLALGAAALLHDWIITAFGHLVEEAFKYLDTGFDHELRMRELLSHDEALGEIGFLDRQILGGRQTNLRPWAKRAVGDFEADALLERIMESISGRGPLGRLISGEMDLDNIDNVYRMAYHMGMSVDRSLPLRLAASMVGVSTAGNPIFKRDAERDVATWLHTRAQVYSRLMPAEPDFAMKMMIIFAAIEAQKIGEIRAVDWHMTDSDFIGLLQKSKSSAARDTIERWLAGEFWATIPLQWISGARPSYPDLLTFSEEVSATLNRQCFAYGIKDKRHRLVEVEFDDGACRSFGRKSNSWLFGLGSPKRQAFTNNDVQTVIELLNKRFKSEALGVPEDLFSVGQSSEEHACLL